MRESTIKQAWDQSAGFDDNLLFGSHKTNIDLLTLHPDPVQIFRLWQIYLDHVNPLLKVTHTSSLQARIIEAAGNLTSIDPPLEALMFSIYSMSILSLDADECPTMFGSSKEDVLTGYQFGCQQALLNCSFLRSSSRDCLTALYLYLVCAIKVFPIISAESSRSPSDRTPCLHLCHLCSGSQSVSRNACASTANHP